MEQNKATIMPWIWIWAGNGKDTGEASAFPKFQPYSKESVEGTEF